MPDRYPACPRCTEPGCPWRWRAGSDRPCPEHHGRRDPPGALAALLRAVPRPGGKDEHDEDEPAAIAAPAALGSLPRHGRPVTQTAT